MPNVTPVIKVIQIDPKNENNIGNPEFFSFYVDHIRKSAKRQIGNKAAQINNPLIFIL